MNVKAFGKHPSGKRLDRIKNSPNYRDGKFHNVEPTSVNPKDVSIFKILKKIMTRPDSVRPSTAIPSVKTNLKDLYSETPVIVWFGHSSYFIHVAGFNVLVDPVFSGNASPFDFFGKAFEGSNIYGPQDLPKIDLLVLTHDHYDHLDWTTIKEIRPKVEQIITSLGVGAHLESWQIPAGKITELDWWQPFMINENIHITATPSRHFSGRRFKRAQTLWSSFVLKMGDYNIFIGGDSGYSSSFREIGEICGPFDLAFMECGQYNQYWPQIHMFPEEAIQAAIDLGASIAFPLHWGKFVLSTHPWNEPVERFVKAAREKKCAYVAPQIGQPFYLGKEFQQKEWWQFENQTDHEK